MFLIRAQLDELGIPFSSGRGAVKGITKEQLAEWRKQFEERSFTSAIDEYCPKEFELLLDAVEGLHKENTELLKRLSECEGRPSNALEKTTTIRELAEIFPALYNNEYKNTESDDYVPLVEALAQFGFELFEENECFVGEYNSLQGYLNCKIKRLGS